MRKGLKWSHRTGKTSFSENFFNRLCFFRSCDFNLNFFTFSQKCVFPIVEKFNISAIYKSIILIFQWIFLWYLSTSFIRKNFKYNNQENLENKHPGEVGQGTLKLKYNISNHRNFSVNLPMVFIYFYFSYFHCLVEVLQGSYFKFLAQMFQNISIGNF